jgi:hypothetical protein
MVSTAATTTANKGQKKNTNLLIEIEMQRLVICHELDKKLQLLQNGGIYRC